MTYSVSMNNKTLTADLLRGHTDTIILKLLSDADRYGYEIMKMVNEITASKYQLKEPTMYSSLKRLEKEMLITSYWGDETNGGRRKYYRITVGGWQRYQSNMQDWAYAKNILDQLLHVE